MYVLSCNGVATLCSKNEQKLLDYVKKSINEVIWDKANCIISQSDLTVTYRDKYTKRTKRYSIREVRVI